MSAPPEASKSADFDKNAPPLAIWIGFFAMILGNFMAMLDIQIVSSALPAIQAGVSATHDEVSWVQTSYLIAEVIGIPLCGFLARALGTRALFCLSAASFTVASLLCAFAWDIQSLTIFRALQGFLGAAMIPTTMATQFLIFSRRLQAMSSVAVGIVVMLGNSLGPALGGYIADALGWRALFWLNLAPGVLCTIIVWRFLKLPAGDISLLRRVDVKGLIGLALFLGGVQYLLEEGASHDWFTSSEMVVCACLSLCGAMIFFYRAFTAADPIVDLRPFKTPSFSIGSGLGFILGISVFSTLFMMPLFLSSVRGYSSAQIGEAMMVQGATMLVAGPPLSFIIRTVRDTRLIGMVGVWFVAVSCWMQIGMTADWGAVEMALPQVARGIGFSMSISAIMMPSISYLPPDQVHTAAGLFNTIRNIGGAFGIALLATMQKYDVAFHRHELYAAVDSNNTHISGMISGMEAYFSQTGSAAPERQALMYYAALLDREALVMTFNDQYLILAIVLTVAAPVMLLIKPPTRTSIAPVQIEQAAHA